MHGKIETRWFVFLLLLFPLLNAIDANGSAYSIGTFQTSQQGTNNETGSVYRGENALTAFQPVSDNATGPNTTARIGFFPLPQLGNATAANLQINSFSVSSSTLPRGQTATFTIIIENTGNLLAIAQAQVYFYNASSDQVDAFNYSNVTIAGGETQTLTTGWDSNRLPEGVYTVSAVVKYNGTETPPAILSLAITPPLAPQPISTESRGKKINLTVYPKPPHLENISPLQGPGLRILRYPILKEMTAGETGLVFPLVENPSGEPITVSFTATGSGAPLISQFSSVAIPSHANSSIQIPIEIPDSVPSGYYTMTIEFSVNGTNSSYPMIIHVLPAPAGDNGVVYHELSLSPYENQSFVTLRVLNPTASPLDYLQVYERFPAEFWTHAGNFNFTLQPAEIDSEHAIMRWDLSNMLPDETRTFVYSVPSLPVDLSQYLPWPISQIVKIQPTSLKNIIIEDVTNPPLKAGEEGQFVIKLFNAGTGTESVHLDITGPADWNVTPESFSLLITSRKDAALSFVIISPQQAAPGSYPFFIRLTYEDTYDQKPLSIHVIAPSTPPKPLHVLLLEWLGKNILALVLAATAILLCCASFYIIYKKVNKPRYEEKRVEMLKGISRMFKSSKPGYKEKSGGGLTS